MIKMAISIKCKLAKSKIWRLCLSLTSSMMKKVGRGNKAINVRIFWLRAKRKMMIDDKRIDDAWSVKRNQSLQSA